MNNKILQDNGILKEVKEKITALETVKRQLSYLRWGFVTFVTMLVVAVIAVGCSPDNGTVLDRFKADCPGWGGTLTMTAPATATEPAHWICTIPKFDGLGNPLPDEIRKSWGLSETSTVFELPTS